MKKILVITALAAASAAPALAQLKPPSTALQPSPSIPAAAPAPAAAADPATADKEQAARLAAQGWIILLDRSDWGRAWETTSLIFQKMVPLGTWMDAIPKARQPLGVAGDRAIVESAYKTTLAGQPNGEYVTVIFRTKFASREAIEAVTTVLDRDGRWRVTGYSAQ